MHPDIKTKIKAAIMISSPRIERERKRKTKEIVAAAEKIFLKKGYIHSSMEDIAKELDLTKPALYRYVDSKDDLYSKVTLRTAKIHDKLITEAFNSKKTGLEQILAIGLAQYKFYKQKPEHYKNLLYYRTCFINKHIKFFGDKDYIYLVAKAIETGKKDGTINNEIDTLFTAKFLVEAIYGIIYSLTSMEKALEVMDKTEEEYVQHSLKLIGNILLKKS